MTSLPIILKTLSIGILTTLSMNGIRNLLDEYHKRLKPKRMSRIKRLSPSQTRTVLLFLIGAIIVISCAWGCAAPKYGCPATNQWKK